MIAPACDHSNFKKHGKDRYGNPRFRCKDCGVTWIESKPKLLGGMYVSLDDAKLAMRLLVEGNSIRATERITDMHRDTVCKVLVKFGEACKKFLDEQMQGLTPKHLQFDEQWTYVSRKQARLTVDEKAERHDVGDIYLWTCIDKQTKLMPSFLIGKRSADNARRFMRDVASRVVFPKPGSSDDHAYQFGSFKPVVQISTDGFKGYPEAVDLAFGQFAEYGIIIKEYRNASMKYDPNEMVGTKRDVQKGEINPFTICTSHVERLNGTQRLFMKRLNRLTYCFSKKLENLEAAFAMFAAYYNYCWQTRMPGKSGKKRPSAAMMAKLTSRVWSFEELFKTVLENSATQI